MRNLIITLLATSSVDSLNPIGITQQFILQGMVKKPRHIWYFILTTGVVNMIFGYLVYYGIMSVLSSGYDFIVNKLGLILYLAELLLGLALLFWGAKDLIKKIFLIKNKDATETDIRASDEEKARARIKSVTPLALIGVGVVSTASELTSAVPYFAFLAVLLTYKLSFLVLTGVLIFYNLIYMAPFVLMYLIYKISQKHFDRLYSFFRRIFKRLSGFLIPALLLVISGAIIFDAITRIINFV